VILGVSILLILATGFFISGEIIHSILSRELEKETKIKAEKINDILKEVAKQEINSENEEKVKKAKEIIELDEEIKKIEEQFSKYELYVDYLRILKIRKFFRDQKKQE
jgi:hypothetical protein